MSRAARKRARPVLRGPRRGNAPGLPDEIYFSVTQRKLLTPNDFGSLAEAEAGLLAFQDHYQQIVTPFEWKFTKSDLDLLLKRLDAHEPAPALAA